MPYIYLIIAISTEVIGSAVQFLKSSEGFSKFIPSFRIKLNKIRKLKGVKNALYLFNNSHKY
jgi:multidrug transporter EmrE-like cation transporter